MAFRLLVVNVFYDFGYFLTREIFGPIGIEAARKGIALRNSFDVAIPGKGNHIFVSVAIRERVAFLNLSFTPLKWVAGNTLCTICSLIVLRLDSKVGFRSREEVIRFCGMVIETGCIGIK